MFTGLCTDKVPHSSDGSNGYIPQVTFLSLKKRMTELLKDALEVETNSTNTQIILGGKVSLFCLGFHNDKVFVWPPTQREKDHSSQDDFTKGCYI